jgi:hypothetical protein
MKMLSGLALIALALPVGTQAQSYRSISMGPNSMTFIEEGSLQRYAGMASATFFFVFRNPTKDGALAQQANFHISCETGTYSYGNFVNFDAAMKEQSRSDEWKSDKAEPGSVVGTLVDYACRDVLGGGSQLFPHRFAAAGHAGRTLNPPKP